MAQASFQLYSSNTAHCIFTRQLLHRIAERRMDWRGFHHFTRQVSFHRLELLLLARRRAQVVEYPVRLAWVEVPEGDIDVMQFMRRHRKEHTSGTRAKKNANDFGGSGWVYVERPGVRAGQQRHSNSLGLGIYEKGHRWLFQMNHQRHGAVRIDALA